MLGLYRQKSALMIAIAVALILVGLFGADSRVFKRGSAFAQSASCPVFPFIWRSSVNGKPQLVPSSYALDTQSGVAASALNGTNSAAYEVTAPKDSARMHTSMRHVLRRAIWQTPRRPARRSNGASKYLLLATQLYTSGHTNTSIPHPPCPSWKKLRLPSPENFLFRPTGYFNCFWRRP